MPAGQVKLIQSIWFSIQPVLNGEKLFLIFVYANDILKSKGQDIIFMVTNHPCGHFILWYTYSQLTNCLLACRLVADPVLISHYKARTNDLFWMTLC